MTEMSVKEKAAVAAQDISKAKEEKEKNKVIKKLVATNVEGTPHLEIKYEGGGEIPSVLEGYWTSHQVANKAIDGYMALRGTK